MESSAQSYAVYRLTSAATFNMETGFRLTLLAIDDLHAVATVHARAFPHSALTLLGSEAVRRYYEWQLTGPHRSVALGVWNRGILAGFCFGGIFNGALSGFMRKNRFYIARCISMRPWVLLDPMFRSRLLPGLHSLGFPRKRVIITDSYRDTLEQQSFGILAIGVEPTLQRSGVGKALLAASEQTALSYGFNKMHLTVQIANTSAIKFYESMGWKRVSGTEMWSGRMEKVLCSHQEDNSILLGGNGREQ